MKREMKSLSRCFTALAFIAALSLSAMAQSTDSKQGKFSVVDRQREIEWALSGAPGHLRAGAGVYVYQPGGYVKVRDSKNGFNCLVNRVANITAPQCYDAEGSVSNMKADMRRVELFDQGKGAQEVAKIINEEYASGKLIAPRRPGVTYMLSPEFFSHDPKTGEKTQVFVPHVMFYAPYLKNSDIGALPEHTNSHTNIFIVGEGTPGAYIIVVPKHDGSAHESAMDGREKKR